MVAQKTSAVEDTKKQLLDKFSAAAHIIQDFDQSCGEDTWGTHFNDDEDENLSQTEVRIISESRQQSLTLFFDKRHKDNLQLPQAEGPELEEKGSFSDGVEESKENDYQITSPPQPV